MSKNLGSELFSEEVYVKQSEAEVFVIIQYKITKLSRNLTHSYSCLLYYSS